MWLRKAAKLGHPGAQYHLGVREHRASKSGCPPGASEYRFEALTWMLLAIAQGFLGAESAREFVALGMTRDEVDEARRKAVAFRTGQTRSGDAPG
jgi:TPR repeat protein